jgi:hypothetical protein
LTRNDLGVYYFGAIYLPKAKTETVNKGNRVQIILSQASKYSPAICCGIVSAIILKEDDLCNNVTSETFLATFSNENYSVIIKEANLWQKRF